MMCVMTTPLTGTQYAITAGDYSATVVEAGAGLRELTHRGVPLVEGYPADQMCTGGHGQLLLPWPNRVDRGRYRFDGEDHVLPLTEAAAGNAIHGLTRWASWSPAAHTTGHVRLTYRLPAQPGYPFRLDLAVEYRLHAGGGLAVTVTAVNTGSRRAPYGAGAHPYLTVGAPVDECRVTVPADTRLLTDARGIPAGAEPVEGTPFDLRRPRVLGDLAIDHPFTGLDRDGAGNAWARVTHGRRSVALWADEAHNWLQVYTGDRGALAVEPMTCPPNAYATGTGLITLEPGASATSAWGIRADLPS
jgi:aldose 1-epimerase